MLSIRLFEYITIKDKLPKKAKITNVKARKSTGSLKFSFTFLVCHCLIGDQNRQANM